jgi:predicted acyltransferase
MDRRKKHRIILALWVAGFFLIGYGVWSFQAGHLMVVLYLAGSALAYIVYAFSARCPHCRWPVLLRPCNLLGIELFVWSLAAPDLCRQCGRPLE